MSEEKAHRVARLGRGASCMLASLIGLAVGLLALTALLLVRVVALEGAVAAIQERRPEPLPAIVPRGDLAQAEETTIELFQRASPSVAYVTSVIHRADQFSRNVLEAARGSGSGFVWDEGGHVVTNYHVVRGADAFRVTLGDQTTWPARLVGFAANKDLAVLRIDAPPDRLRPLPRGTSSDLAVGQHVYAIGNPFGLDHTLSTGVISGLGREIESVGGRPITGVVQTDAAINPGNSGGPLLDSAGRLIGVNTAIYSPSGASAGVGFAVPVDTVSRIVPQLILHGREIRPTLGIHVAEASLALRFGVGRGVMILKVDPGSPAAVAGLQAIRQDPATGAWTLGDVITHIGGAEVESPDGLYRVLDHHSPGERVTLRLRRAGTQLEVQAQLATTVDTTE